MAFVNETGQLVTECISCGKILRISPKTTQNFRKNGIPTGLSCSNCDKLNSGKRGGLNLLGFDEEEILSFPGKKSKTTVKEIIGF